jgi:hypothetical protein
VELREKVDKGAEEEEERKMKKYVEESEKL